MRRLRQRADFLAAATGAKAPVTGFVLQALDRCEDGPVRVGFTVSGKVGTAVERNRVRRRLREMVRLAGRDRLRPGHDYVVIGRRAALTLPFERLIEDFDRALHRVHAQNCRAGRMNQNPPRRGGARRLATPHAGSH